MIRFAEGGALLGLAVPFDVAGWVGPHASKRIRPGAFTRFLRSVPDVPAVLDHEAAQVVGSTGDGSLTLRETPAGLMFHLVVRSTTTHDQTLLKAVRWGQITGVSCMLHWSKTARRGAGTDLTEVGVLHIGLLM